VAFAAAADAATIIPPLERVGPAPGEEYKVSDEELLDYARELLDRAGILYSDLVRARDGREHHLFRLVVDRDALRVLKFARGDGIGDPFWPDRTPLQALEAEREALAVARGVRVPGHYLILPGDPPGALMEMLPGTPPEQLALRGRLDPDTLANICHMMGELLATIHSVRRPAGPSAIRDLPGVEIENARLLHMDFHLGNVVGTLQLGQRWRPLGVIDWTCCHWGPREADMAEMGVSVFATNPSAFDAFLAGYRKSSGQAQDPRVVKSWIGRELLRRMEHDPPTEESVRNLWRARIDEWVAPGSG
jgi:GNAT superfamily N-acetyltransferase